MDLEQHRVVDLLPNATAQTLTTWLQAHPGVEILSRDRAGAYAEGARQGAPTAVQVADRWHLLKNLSETLERVLDQNRAALKQAAPALQEPVAVAWPPTKGKIAEEESQERRRKRLERYEQVRQLHQQGVGLREIARQLPIARATVAHYIRAGTFPERAPRSPEPTSLDPFKPYLHKRWQEGCRNACCHHPIGQPIRLAVQSVARLQEFFSVWLTPLPAAKVYPNGNDIAAVSKTA